MRAYKFLAADRHAPFSGFRWPEREWVETAGSLHICRSGIHACRPEHLAYWVMDELWAVELDGDIDDESGLKVVARRGFLVERVDAWNDEAKGDFMVEGVRRTAHYAAAELREVGLAAEADLLEQARMPADFAERAGAAADAAAEAGESDAADLARYVVDAARYAEDKHTVGPAFIAAHAADVHAPEDVADPFAAERVSQGLWLAERLGLSEAGV
jgi:hypothetical protein